LSSLNTKIRTKATFILHLTEDQWFSNCKKQETVYVLWKHCEDLMLNQEKYDMYLLLPVKCRRRNDSLSSWSRVLPENPTDPKMLKKFPAFYKTRRFITVFTRARHLSLS
jgi:hypothetical protein